MLCILYKTGHQPPILTNVVTGQHPLGTALYLTGFSVLRNNTCIVFLGRPER